MNITEIVESAGWKNFMAKLYGMGATIVIVGALFKINHWPGGVYFITAGMTVEAIIFFFSSFEPLHEELDWTLVYPELAGMSDPDELENFKASAAGMERQIENVNDLKGGAEGAPISGGGAVSVPHAGAPVDAGGAVAVASSAFEGIKGFDVSKMPDFTKATEATKDYVNNIEKAATGVTTLNETYAATNESIKESATSLTNSYFKTADAISQSGDMLSNAYSQVASALNEGNTNIAENSKVYGSNIEKLNNSISSLNVLYEEQIKESSDKLKNSNELYTGLEQMVSNLKDSVDETQKYKEEMSKLRGSIESLNSVYSNMLQGISSISQKKS